MAALLHVSYRPQGGRYPLFSDYSSPWTRSKGGKSRRSLGGVTKVEQSYPPDDTEIGSRREDGMTGTVSCLCLVQSSEKEGWKQG